MLNSIAIVPTPRASRYLQQLCKHWAHNLDVEFDPQKGRVTFPKNARGADWPGDAVLTLSAGDMALTCQINASCEGQLSGLQGAVERHLNRFAFREGELTFNWAKNTS